MPVSKIKNLILLILALSVVCLLFLAVPMRTAQIQAEDALHAQLEELFASYDIQLDRAILPRSVDLYTVELSGQQADNAAAAAALLGADAALQPDSSHYAATYLSPAGSCTFRAGGGFRYVLHDLCGSLFVGNVKRAPLDVARQPHAGQYDVVIREFGAVIHYFSPLLASS